MSDEHARVAAAWKALAELQRPEGLRGSTWLAVWAVLHRLCRYARYDVIRPTQDGLAEELDVTRNTVRDALDTAEQHGLIKREPWDDYGGRWEHTRYHLTFVDLHVANPGITAKGAPRRGGRSTTAGNTTVVGEAPRSHGGTSTTDRGARSTTNTPPSEEENTAPFGSSDNGPPSSSLTLSKEERVTNQHPGWCHVCEEHLAPGEGFLHGKKPVCPKCDDPVRWDADQAAQRQIRDAEKREFMDISSKRKPRPEGYVVPEWLREKYGPK